MAKRPPTDLTDLLRLTKKMFDRNKDILQKLRAIQTLEPIGDHLPDDDDDDEYDELEISDRPDDGEAMPEFVSARPNSNPTVPMLSVCYDESRRRAEEETTLIPGYITSRGHVSEQIPPWAQN